MRDQIEETSEQQRTQTKITSLQGTRQKGKSAYKGNDFRFHLLFSYFYISYKGISVYGKN